ncbi:MAG: oligosaccharide flippase family protein [Clostridia bacterium]|nr:oligosaccharide flippase family protein [Clostridia bacterium]
MKRLKLLVENMLVYGLSYAIAGAIPYIMLPVITYLMPNSDYVGIYDVATSLMSLLSTCAIFGMYDAMFRLFFDDEDEAYKKKVCTSAITFVLVSAALVWAVVFLCAKPIAVRFLGGAEYDHVIRLVSVNIFFVAVNALIAAPTRMQNKKILVLIINAIIPVVSYTFAYALLCKGYYTTGMIIGNLISVCVSVLIYFFFNHSWFQKKYFDLKIVKDLLKIALPVVPVVLIYWIFNTLDRIIISQLLGNAQTGIYGVGAKIAQLSQLLYLAFSGGWQYFAFSTMKDQDQVEMITRVFELLEGIAFIFGILFISCFAWPYRMLFAEEYWQGIYVVPYLFMAPLLLMLYQIASSQLMIVKKNYYSTICLAMGAVTNIILDIVLVKLIGIEGAAIATLCGYLLSIAACLFVLAKFKLIHLHARMGITLMIMLGYLLYYRLSGNQNLFAMIMIALLLSGIIIMLYMVEIRALLKKNKQGV